MEIYRINNYTDKLPRLEKSSAIIGNFDGFHIGHQELLAESKEYGLLTTVVTFDNLQKCNGYLSNTEEKIYSISKYDVDYLIVLDFDSFKNVFFDEFMKMLKKLNIKMITCDKYFRFGFKNEGDIIDLENNFKVKIIEQKEYNGYKISTTLIKSLLDEGKVDVVETLLNRPYSMSGKVVKGSQIGRLIGFKTANIEYLGHHIPKCGSYKVKCKIDDCYYEGMANIGHNPTINAQDEIRLEIHLFNFDENIYDKFVKVYFLEFLEEEEKLSSKDELVEKLNRLKNKCCN